MALEGLSMNGGCWGEPHAVSEIVEFHVVGSGSENMPRSCQLGVILFVMELDYRESRGNTKQSDSSTSMRPISHHYPAFHARQRVTIVRSVGNRENQMVIL